jgi:hypothetical protein
MKRSYYRFVLALIATGLLLDSCQGSDKVSNQDILNAAADYFGEHIRQEGATVGSRYSVSSGAVVCSFKGLTHIDEMTQVTINGDAFVYGSGNELYVYQKNQIVDLKTGFRELLVSAAETHDIAQKIYGDKLNQVTYPGGEEDGPAIVLQDKIPFTEKLEETSSAHFEVLIDWNFSRHEFTLKDFNASGLFSSFACLSNEAFHQEATSYSTDFNRRYSLTLKEINLANIENGYTALFESYFIRKVTLEKR